MGGHDAFWSLADTLIAQDNHIVEGTIMSSRCLRVGTEFLAMYYQKGGGMVVKLPRSRVDEMVVSGDGQAFAPAGKTFREWVLVPDATKGTWRSLLEEAAAFVAPRRA